MRGNTKVTKEKEKVSRNHVFSVTFCVAFVSFVLAQGLLRHHFRRRHIVKAVPHAHHHHMLSGIYHLRLIALRQI